VDLVAHLLAHHHDPRALDLLAETAPQEQDPLLRVKEARILAQEGDHRGLALAVGLLKEATPPLIRDEAHQLLRERSGQEFGYDPFLGGEENAAAIERWRAWAEDQARAAAPAGGER
jgi:hypothetical protein